MVVGAFTDLAGNDMAAIGSGAYKFVVDSKVGKAKVKGDPHAQNLAGQKFDILALGTLSFLTVKETKTLSSSTVSALELDGTITRVGRDCSQTFISNVTLRGSWLKEITGREVLSVRAVPSVPVEKAMEIGFEGQWQAASDVAKIANKLNTEPRSVTIDFDSKFPGLKFKASTHQHHKWNFLNVDVQGLGQLANTMSNVQIGGILGYDDFTHAIEAPADCKTPQAIHFVREQDESDGSTFLSFCSVS